jgi:hypothetical protein
MEKAIGREICFYRARKKAEDEEEEDRKTISGH